MVYIFFLAVLKRIYLISFFVFLFVFQPRYLSHLVGHEGSGSLLSLLKVKGWANGLSAGPYESATDWSVFMVLVECTKTGLVSQASSHQKPVSFCSSCLLTNS